MNFFRPVLSSAASIAAYVQISGLVNSLIAEKTSDGIDCYEFTQMSALAFFGESGIG